MSDKSLVLENRLNKPLSFQYKLLSAKNHIDTLVKKNFDKFEKTLHKFENLAFFSTTIMFYYKLFELSNINEAMTTRDEPLNYAYKIGALLIAGIALPPIIAKLGKSYWKKKGTPIMTKYFEEKTNIKQKTESLIAKTNTGYDPKNYSETLSKIGILNDFEKDIILSYQTGELISSIKEKLSTDEKLISEEIEPLKIYINNISNQETKKYLTNEIKNLINLNFLKFEEHAPKLGQFLSNDQKKYLLMDRINKSSYKNAITEINEYGLSLGYNPNNIVEHIIRFNQLD